MLKTVNFEGSQPKTIAPEIRITMAMHVLNIDNDSTSNTTVTLQQRDSSVGETMTRATFRLHNEDLAQAGASHSDVRQHRASRGMGIALEREATRFAR